MGCQETGLRAMYKQSGECNALMRKWHAANLALWTHGEHMRAYCPAFGAGVELAEGGYLPPTCSWCGGTGLNSVDRLKMLKQNEQRARQAYQRKQKAEIVAWQKEMQMPMFGGADEEYE